MTFTVTVFLTNFVKGTFTVNFIAILTDTVTGTVTVSDCPWHCHCHFRVTLPVTVTVAVSATVTATVTDYPDISVIQFLKFTKIT